MISSREKARGRPDVDTLLTLGEDMKLDPRLVVIDRADYDEPVDTMCAQLGVITDNLMSGYLLNPAITDSILRRDGMTKTADRLVELFGDAWWQNLPVAQ